MGEIRTPRLGTPVLGKNSHGGSQSLVKSKLVFVGDCACGKTALIKRYMTGEFLEEYIPTGFDTYTATHEVSDSYKIQVSLWDTSGKEEYNRVRPISYTDADIILLCFSIADPESLSNVVTKWYPEIRENCISQPIILVGCQQDRREAGRKSKKKANGLVTYEQGVKTAKTIDAVLYTEISAKSSQKSVKDAIEMAALSTADVKSGRHTATFRRRRSFRRRRLSDISDARRLLRNEVAKSCVVM